MAESLTRVLRLLIVGDEKSATAALEKTGKKAEESGGKLAKFEGHINKLSLGIIGMAGAAGGALLKIGMDFDEAVDTIRIGTGATGDALDELNDNFKNVLKTVPSDMQDVATAIADVNTRLGLTGDNLEDVSRQFVMLADLTGEQVSNLVEGASQAFQAWNVAADDQAEALDKLWRASQNTGISIGDLTKGLIDSAPALQSFGFSMDQSITLLAGMEKAGLNGQQVLAGLRSGLGRLAKEGKDPVQALAEFSAAVQGATSEAEALQLGAEQFGNRAGPMLAKAIRDGKLSFEELQEAIVGGSETISDATWDTADFSEKLQLLKNKAMVELEPAANAVFEALNKLVDKLSEGVDWAMRNQGTIKTLAMIVGGFAAAIVTAAAALRVYHGVMMVIRAATIAWTVAQTALNVAMSLNPIGLVVIAIVALIAIVVLLWTKCEGFRNFFIKAWELIKNAALAVGRWFKETLWEKWIKGAWDSIVNAGKGALEWFKQLPGRIKDAFFGLVNIISWPWRTAFNWISDAWNNTVGRLSWSVPDWVPIIGGRTISAPKLPKLPALAKGGHLEAGQAAIVGEAGWEIFVPDQPGTVVPHGLSAAMLGGGGGITIIVEGSVVTERELARSVATVIRDEIARVGRRNGGRTGI